MAAFVSDSPNPLDCPICVTLLKNPVTTSCGHSFCMNCIQKCWDQNASLGRAYSCPTCRKTFNRRPALNKSTVLAEIVEGTNQEVPALPEDVKCDVCKGRRIKAIKSCLFCMASYCQTHIQPHYESEAFKKHKLVDASPDLQQHICSTHHKALEIYCYNDKKCICVVCMGNHHSGHRTVSAAAEMAKKQEELNIKKRDFTLKITDFHKKVQVYKKAMNSYKVNVIDSFKDVWGKRKSQTTENFAQAAVEHSDRMFSELIRSIQKRKTEVRELIRTQEKREMAQITDHIQQLEQEIANLQNENDKLEPVLHTEDHINFFQSYSPQSGLYVCTASPRDISDLLTFENVGESVSELKNQLIKLCEEHKARITKKVADVQIFKTSRLQDSICFSPVTCTRYAGGTPMHSPSSSSSSSSLLSDTKYKIDREMYKLSDDDDDDDDLCS